MTIPWQHNDVMERNYYEALKRAQGDHGIAGAELAKSLPDLTLRQQTLLARWFSLIGIVAHRDGLMEGLRREGVRPGEKITT